MPLLSAQDRATVQKHLEGLTHPVTLLFFTQTIGAPETVHITRQIVNELAELSSLITVEEVNLVLDRERAAQYGVRMCPPSCLLKDGADTRMRFLGAPAGYEFMSLVEAVTLAGTDGSGLLDSSKVLLASRLDAPGHQGVRDADLRLLPARGHDGAPDGRGKSFCDSYLGRGRRVSRAVAAVSGNRCAEDRR